MTFLNENLDWLHKLQTINKDRKSHFINGWIRNINGLKELSKQLVEELFQIYVEEIFLRIHWSCFFGKIRSIANFTDTYSFKYAYAFKAPMHFNCEDDYYEEEDNVHLVDALIYVKQGI